MTDEIVKFIKQVAIDHQKPQDVAQAFLKAQGLLP